MKTNQLRTIAAVTLFASVMFTSCKKEKIATAADDATVSNHVLVEQAISDIQRINSDAANLLTGAGKMADASSTLSGCATYTFDTVSMPHKITIDFGTGCRADDRITRKGKVIVSYDAVYTTAGSTWTVTFDNFFQDNRQELGSWSVHNNGLNVKGNYEFIETSNLQIVQPNGGGTITSNSNGVAEWVSGSSTTYTHDDQYSVTGSTTGSFADGNSFNYTIEQPLTQNFAPGCVKWFTQGTVRMAVTGSPDKVIDYGDGACDNLAVVTTNGVSQAVVLR